MSPSVVSVAHRPWLCVLTEQSVPHGVVSEHGEQSMTVSGSVSSALCCDDTATHSPCSASRAYVRGRMFFRVFFYKNKTLDVMRNIVLN